MVIACQEVWSQISNYIEDDVAPEMRASMDEHIKGCQRCRAVLDGARNVVQLYGDERMVQVPLGFSSRLQRRLEEQMPRRRGSAWGWMIALAAAAMVLVTLQVGSSAQSPVLRSEHAQPGVGVPAGMMVVVAEEGKTFHVAGCKFIHDKARERTMTAAEALREGYVPCVRCMREYLGQTAAEALERSEENAEIHDGE